MFYYARLAEAGEMTSSLLHVSSKKFLFETIEKHLLLPHTAYLIEKGLSQMLSDNRIADLKRMFLLFDRVSSLSMVKAGWTLYIRQYGEALVSNKASESYVEDVLKFQVSHSIAFIHWSLIHSMIPFSFFF